MHHDLEKLENPEAVADEAARIVADRATRSVAENGRFTFAVSGGHTPWEMFDRLARHDIPWGEVTLYQVDERVAPDGDEDRNLTHLRQSLGAAEPEIVAMPVEADDLDEAASRYADRLPEHFDLIHLGLGPDGHTASLVPGDAVLEVTDRPVALTGVYQDRRRMTLTYPALARADELLWLVTGADKKAPLHRLLGGDRGIPAGQVQAARSLVLADAAAT